MGEKRVGLPVLFVDDDPAVVTAFRYSVGDAIELLTAGSGAEALEVLRERDVAVLMTDQRMSEMTGVELCARARALRPDAIRILVTAYADVQAAIDAINEGQVSRWVGKPWRDEDMLEVVRTAVELAGARRQAQALQARLLGSGPVELAAALHEQLAHEIASPVSLLNDVLADVHTLRENLAPLAASSTDAANTIAGLDALHKDAAVAIEQLGAICERFQRIRGAAAVDVGVSACNVADIVESVVSLVHNQPGARHRVTLRVDTRPRVACDDATVGEIALNLVRNAIHAIGDAVDGTVRVTLTSSDESAVLAVHDNGPGVPAELREQVFLPGVTTKPGGSGVGLFVARALARRAGGDLVLAACHETSGAAFEVRLPLATRAAR